MTLEDVEKLSLNLEQEIEQTIFLIGVEKNKREKSVHIFYVQQTKGLLGDVSQCSGEAQVLIF